MMEIDAVVLLSSLVYTLLPSPPVILAAAIMCILAFITEYSPRFPLVLVSNRDELLERLTHPLAVDSATGLLWAVDGVAGGSWLGLEPHSGRFATVTNARRAPTAPLTGAASGWRAPAGWRGAAPLDAVIPFTRAAPAYGDTAHWSLQYTPTTSRGAIIHDYLARGVLPGDPSATDTPPSLAPPYYAGYNLLTCPSLYGAGGELALAYTTNRYGVEYAAPVAPRAVHCLQNSFVDDWREPKSRVLRDLLSAALPEVLGSLPAGAPLDAVAAATALADRCLDAAPGLDLVALSKGPDAVKAAEATAVLTSGSAMNGFSADELEQHFGAHPYSPVAEERMEAWLQANICVPPYKGYGTRTQSVVLVERTAAGVAAGEGECVVHILQRAAQGDRTWVHHAKRRPAEA